MKFEIPGRLPGLNEIIAAAKDHYGAYVSMKDTYTTQCAWYAKKLPRHGRVDVHITWHEPNARRDPDNITAGQKFILDGLVVAGVIRNDSQKYIKRINHEFEVDSANPRVEVELVPVKK